MNSASTNKTSKNYYAPSKNYYAPSKNYYAPSALNLTKKKEPKKEFSLTGNSNAFPTLNQVAKNNNARTLLSFANATKTELQQPTESVVNDVMPGWVNIRRNNGKIEYKYSKPSNRYPSLADNDEHVLSNIILKYRLAKEQYVRDNDIARLGDLSEYYGEKTIYEMFEEEERQIYHYDSDNNSSSSDMEYDVYIDTYENNKFENFIQ